MDRGVEEGKSALFTTGNYAEDLNLFLGSRGRCDHCSASRETMHAAFLCTHIMTCQSRGTKEGTEKKARKEGSKQAEQEACSPLHKSASPERPLNTGADVVPSLVGATRHAAAGKQAATSRTASVSFSFSTGSTSCARGLHAHDPPSQQFPP